MARNNNHSTHSSKPPQEGSTPMNGHPSGPFFDLGLIPEICERVEKLGYKTPTPIQKDAVPLILDGHDVIGIAQTGTGKTAAFMLPMLDSLICSKPTKNRDRPRVLVLEPTR